MYAWCTTQCVSKWGARKCTGSRLQVGCTTTLETMRTRREQKFEQFWETYMHVHLPLSSGSKEEVRRCGYGFVFTSGRGHNPMGVRHGRSRGLLSYEKSTLTRKAWDSTHTEAWWGGSLGVQDKNHGICDREGTEEEGWTHVGPRTSMLWWLIKMTPIEKRIGRTSSVTNASYRANIHAPGEASLAMKGLLQPWIRILERQEACLTDQGW